MLEMLAKYMPYTEPLHQGSADFWSSGICLDLFTAQDEQVGALLAAL